MTKPKLHPWLDSTDALKAAHAAVDYAEDRLPAAARAHGLDELFGEALSILTDCALPPRERGHIKCAQCGGTLDHVRPGAKFCSEPCRMKHKNARRGTGDDRGTRKPGLASVPSGYIGSMWGWPEDDRIAYAVREVGLALCNYLRVQGRIARNETANSPRIEDGTAKAMPTVRLQNDPLTGNAVTLDEFRKQVA